MNLEEVFEKAKEAMKNAYSPYSNFCVGAALVTKSGKVYTGCNIENHGIMSICAERVAFLKAISEGEKEFEYIVIVAGKRNGKLEPTTPCGYCRQFMSEFVSKDFKIYCLDEQGNIKEYEMCELLPENFSI
jgi:cytidine deaminase